MNEVNDRVREELGIVHHRRTANWLGAALIVGISTIATMAITVPPAPIRSSNAAAPTAIGGGPSPVEDGTGGMDCQTTDGAPYVAERCSPGP